MRQPAPHRQRNDRGGSAGVSLLEVLVALALLAWAATLALPLVRGPSEGMSLEATAQTIVTDLRTARAAALRENTAQGYVVDVAGRRVGTERAGLRTVPDGTRIEVTVAAADVVAPDTVRVRFFPDGSATGGTIVLRRGGQSVAIAIDWLSGRVTTTRPPA